MGREGRKRGSMSEYRRHIRLPRESKVPEGRRKRVSIKEII